MVVSVVAAVGAVGIEIVAVMPVVGRDGLGLEVGGGGFGFESEDFAESEGTAHGLMFLGCCCLGCGLGW